jgi:hypothetical protein
MQRRIWTALAAVACTGGVSLAQIVSNPGFEDDIVQEPVTPVAGNWSTFYGPSPSMLSINDNVQFHGGSRSYHMYCIDGLNSYTGAQQNVMGITGNLSYDFKFWGKAGMHVNGPTTNAGIPNGIDIKIEWRNTAGGATGTTALLHPVLTDSWQQFTLTATAPTDAVAANLVFAVQSFTFLIPQTAGAEGYFDDVTFTASGNQATIGTCCGPAAGECLVSTQANCTVGGTWTSTIATCAPNPCPGAPGACCNPKTGACAFTTKDDICTSLGGKFLNPGVLCDANPCPPGCPSDFSGDGHSTVDDIFVFLNSWFAGCP